MEEENFHIKVLVVDDVQVNLIAMKRIINRDDLEVITASSGYEALELTMKHDFAVILLDVQMPDVDGYETAEMIKMAEHSKHIPIIFVTANSTEEQNIMKGYNVGAIDYITKPVNKVILCSKVNVLVDLYKKEERLKKLNAELMMSQREANESNVLKSEFLANISHELRTPMHAITGFVELGIMCMDKWKSTEQLDNLNEIKESSLRLLNLINDLLDLSKMEANAIEFHTGDYKLENVINESIRTLKSLIDEKKLKIDIKKCDDLPRAECDSSKISQVIINFLSNAIKFSDEGNDIVITTEETMLNIGRRKTDCENVPAVSVSIIDSGIGIPEDELDSVFNKFIQSSTTKTGAGGTGLGLAICKEIIEGHAGKIWAENIPDGGAKFSFTIPIIQPFRGE